MPQWAYLSDKLCTWCDEATFAGCTSRSLFPNSSRIPLFVPACHPISLDHRSQAQMPWLAFPCGEACLCNCVCVCVHHLLALSRTASQFVTSLPHNSVSPALSPVVSFPCSYFFFCFCFCYLLNLSYSKPDCEGITTFTILSSFMLNPHKNLNIYPHPLQCGRSESWYVEAIGNGLRNKCNVGYSSLSWYHINKLETTQSTNDQMWVMTCEPFFPFVSEHCRVILKKSKRTA